MTNTPDMDGRPDFIRLQYAFAAHIRDPQHHAAPPGIEERRMAVYRELFFNNVESFLSGSFPVLRSLYAATDWLALARDFFAQHRSRSPLFLEIAREFLHWVEHERAAQPADPPWLFQLAHYEWVELAVAIQADAAPVAGCRTDGDLLDDAPVLSPLAWHLRYDWPVHRIGPDFRPGAQDRAMTCLVVYRKPDDEIGFLEINPVTKRLLELVETADGRSGRTLLAQIAGELAHPDPLVVIDAGRVILDALREKTVILGTRAATAG